MWIWPCIIVNMLKLKGQLDATDWVLYCKTYCLLNMFRAPLCPSTGAQDLYRWLLPVLLALWFTCCWSGVDLWVVCLVCGMFLDCSRETSCKPDTEPMGCFSIAVEKHPAKQTHNPQLHTRTTTCKPKCQVPQAATICITLELLIMGIMVPKTCWVNSKFCNK